MTKLRVQMESPNKASVVLTDKYGTTRLQRVTEIKLTADDPGLSLRMFVENYDLEITIPDDIGELLAANERQAKMLAELTEELAGLKAVKLCARCALAEIGPVEEPTTEIG